METTCLRGLFDKNDDGVHPLVNNTMFKACPDGMRFDTKEVLVLLLYKTMSFFLLYGSALCKGVLCEIATLLRVLPVRAVIYM